MLEVRDVSKRYGAFTAVRHVSFAVKPGEVLGYLGPNGSGKSTTVRMLVGLMPPTSGAILLDGEDIHRDLVAYKAQIGYVPEEAHVYTYLTGPEYLRLSGRLRGIPDGLLDRKIDRLLNLFELDTDYHAPLSSFSKGMRQKVLLSAALLHNPRIVVLDEPASGLDVSTALVLRTVVRSLADDGRIIFYSSHELDTVERISTRVMILHEGTVVADDSPQRLRELAHVPSLEDVFAKLTVRQQLDEIAGGVIEAVRLR
ncbi:MAG: ABC transporter ATP-binding protein [Acidobacteria bacterium]|nr:ABC transporter ATP-binding protein [Acidobacteriota bacterium]